MDTSALERSILWNLQGRGHSTPQRALSGSIGLRISFRKTRNKNLARTDGTKRCGKKKTDCSAAFEKRPTKNSNQNSSSFDRRGRPEVERVERDRQNRRTRKVERGRKGRPERAR